MSEPKQVTSLRPFWPIVWTEWVRDPFADQYIRQAYIEEFAPRYYGFSDTLLGQEIMANPNDEAKIALIEVRTEIGILSLVDAIQRAWHFEVPGPEEVRE